MPEDEIDLSVIVDATDVSQLEDPVAPDPSPKRLIIISATNLRWANAAHTLLDATAQFDAFPGPVPYTFASGEWPDDWDALAGRPDIAAYEPPPAPVPPTISDRQFFQALAMPPFGLITPAEAIAAVKTGDIPAVMQGVVDALPDDQRFGVEMILSGATQFNRTDPLVAIFGASQSMDEAAIDAFWRFAATL